MYNFPPSLQLDGFSCPRLQKEIESLQQQLDNERTAKITLEEQKATLEEVMGNMKEQHKEYIKSFEDEMQKSMEFKKETLMAEHESEKSECKFTIKILTLFLVFFNSEMARKSCLLLKKKAVLCYICL